MKAAHAVVSSATYRKSGSPIFFVPRTLGRTWGTRPVLRLFGVLTQTLKTETGKPHPAIFDQAKGMAKLL
jgi:hypothetical protein